MKLTVDNCVETLSCWIVPAILGCGLYVAIVDGCPHQMVNINLGLILFITSCLEALNKIKKWVTDFAFGTVCLAYSAFLLLWNENAIALLVAAMTVITFLFAYDNYKDNV